MTTAAQQFHFLPDDVGSTPAGERPLLPIPEGVSFLVVRQGAAQIYRRAPRSRAAIYLLEPVTRDGHRSLLLLTTNGAPPLVNGSTALPTQLLQMRDEVHVGDAVLHVSIYNRPHVGPPADEHLGKPCPVCTTAIEADRRVYVCSNCGTAIHAEGDERPADDRLECAALIRDCSSCGHAIAAAGSEGFLYEPEK